MMSMESPCRWPRNFDYRDAIVSETDLYRGKYFVLHQSLSYGGVFCFVGLKGEYGW